jgi:hypothetical protein
LARIVVSTSNKKKDGELRKGVRTISKPARSLPLQYSRHASYGARVFFNATGYQANTFACWFERDKLDKHRWAFKVRRKGAAVPHDEYERLQQRACAFLRRHGLNPDTATYPDIIELAKSFESRPRRRGEVQHGLAE